jgi:hypothetical protein
MCRRSRDFRFYCTVVVGVCIVDVPLRWSLECFPFPAVTTTTELSPTSPFNHHLQHHHRFLSFFHLIQLSSLLLLSCLLFHPPLN